MKFNLTYQYRLYPNQVQAAMLDYLLWQGRKIYNAALEQRINLWRDGEQKISLYDQRDYFCALRKQDEYAETYALLPFSTVDALIRRLDKAYKAFFRRVKAGETPGFPKFKGRYYWNSLDFVHGSGTKLHKQNGKWAKLRIMNVGEIRLRYHRPIPDNATIKMIVVKRDKRGKWFANCQLELIADEAPQHPGDRVGIDVGISSLLALSDGTLIDNPRWYRQMQAKRGRLARQLSRRQRWYTDKDGKRTKPMPRVMQYQNWHDVCDAIAKLEDKIARTRRDFYHKIADDLTRTYSLIALEDLSPEFMIQNKHLAMSAQDAAWSTFKELLEYKAQERGVELVYVDPAYTSQTCSQCGHVAAESRETQAKFQCVSCGFVENADLNAARNILERAIKPAGHAGHAIRQPVGAYLA